jgi:hypothetical protein
MAASMSVQPRSIPWRVATIAVTTLVVALMVFALTIGFGSHGVAHPVSGSGGVHSTLDDGCYPTHPGKVC